MPKPNRCEVCGEPQAHWVPMCRACNRSYDSTAHIDGSVLEAILWAARRSRWYAERKAARYTRARQTTRRVKQ